MADPQPPATPEVPPKAPAKAKTPDDGSINAAVTGSVYDPAGKPDLDPDDPGINANVVS